MILLCFLSTFAFIPSNNLVTTFKLQRAEDDIKTLRIKNQKMLSHRDEDVKMCIKKSIFSNRFFRIQKIWRFRSFKAHNEKHPIMNRSKKIRRRAKILLASISIFTSIILNNPKLALADHPLQNIPSGKISLRPGMTIDELEREVAQTNELTIDERIAAQKGHRASQNQGDILYNNNSAKKDRTGREAMFDIDEEYDFDEDTEDDMELSSLGVTNPNEYALDITSSGAAQTVTTFSGSAPQMSSKTKNIEVGKTVVKIMGPIFTFCFARETLRWNREQNNVDKGIAIMEQQKQEYLRLKNEDDEGNDDDDDDVDDDDDDDDENDDYDDDDEDEDND